MIHGVIHFVHDVNELVTLDFQEYIESTDLAKKVSRWHESIGPRLERVERRAAFDVHEYGTSILSKFPESDAQVRV